MNTTTNTTEKRAEELTRKLTAFATWGEFLAAGATGYSPTLRGWNKRTEKEANELANLFDSAMVASGHAARAWPAR